MKYKYAVFDWDGTIADTYPVILAAYDYTFAQMNLPKLSDDEIRKAASTIQNKDMLSHLFGERKEEAARYFYEYITRFHTRRLKVQPGARELLDFCRKLGIASYLITNKKTKFIREEMARLGVDEYFIKVVAAGELSQDKPHPIACRAVFDNQLPPAEEIVVIGDGEADVKTAKALNGADCIIYDPQNKYRGAPPTYTVRNLREAAEILEKTNGK